MTVMNVYLGKEPMTRLKQVDYKRCMLIPRKYLTSGSRHRSKKGFRSDRGKNSVGGDCKAISFIGHNYYG